MEDFDLQDRDEFFNAIREHLRTLYKNIFERENKLRTQSD